MTLDRDCNMYSLIKIFPDSGISKTNKWPKLKTKRHCQSMFKAFVLVHWHFFRLIVEHRMGIV